MTGATAIVDRGGRRVRFYRRQQPDRPGQQERRRMASRGLRWCGDCACWLPSEQVTRQGRCRLHEREANRRWYAEKGAQRVRQRVRARRRGCAPVPPLAQDYLTEQFDGRCAYCGAPATTWDHVIPLRAGGQTKPGNILPACVPCNSSKNSRDVSAWVTKAGRVVHDEIGDVLILAEMGY